MATEPLDETGDDLLEESLATLHRKALTLLKRLRESAVDPETGHKKGPAFSISKAAS